MTLTSFFISSLGNVQRIIEDHNDQSVIYSARYHGHYCSVGRTTATVVDVRLWSAGYQTTLQCNM